jgi:hypothetical protein
VAYKVPDRWNADDIRVVLLSDVSEGDIVTVEVTIGDISLRIMGEIREHDRRLAAVGAHISSTGIKPNEVGIANLRLVAQALMEVGGYDEIVVEGAIRTTGARPGHRPRAIRFARNGDPVPAAGFGPDKIG